MTGHSVAMVAGEKSGDLLASALLGGLHAREFFANEGKAAGIGGDAMAAQGFENWWHIDALSVRGYLEVLPALPRLLWMRARLRRRILDWHPNLFIGVDAPDFNLDLELALRSAGQRVVHFISPSIWAWRRERIEKIRQAVDHMLLVFPFEAELYAQAGIPATYVGHPLADVIAPVVDRSRLRLRLGLAPHGPLIALLPGSRPDEVRFMASTFLQTAVWLLGHEPNLQFVLPAANAALGQVLRQLCSQLAGSAAQHIHLIEGQAHEALGACDTALIASGTATLEAMFFHRPMVIAYKMSALSYRLMRNKGYLPFIGLPNILSGEFVVPEFIQEQAEPVALGQALLAQMNDAAAREAISRRFEDLHNGMRLGCAERAAAVLAQQIEAV
jgi:lipid-A-disaccharide synthase